MSVSKRACSLARRPAARRISMNEAESARLPEASSRVCNDQRPPAGIVGPEMRARGHDRARFRMLGIQKVLCGSSAPLPAASTRRNGPSSPIDAAVPGPHDGSELYGRANWSPPNLGSPGRSGLSRRCHNSGDTAGYRLGQQRDRHRWSGRTAATAASMLGHLYADCKSVAKASQVRIM